jgi:hypothetical protein
MSINAWVLMRSRPSNQLAAHARLLELTRGPAAENFWVGLGWIQVDAEAVVWGRESIL